MKRIAVAAALLGLTVTAQAADIPYGSRAPYTVNQPLNAYSWAGPYLGGNIGYAWGSVANNPAKPSGFAGGVQGGYNFQSGPLVFGLEADIQASGANDTFAPWKFSNPWFGTVRGRVGYALNNILFYGTGGPAFENCAARRSASGKPYHREMDRERRRRIRLRPDLTAKIEYLYVDLSDSRFTSTGPPNGYQFGLVRVGVNYRSSVTK